MPRPEESPGLTSKDKAELWAPKAAFLEVPTPAPPAAPWRSTRWAPICLNAHWAHPPSAQALTVLASSGILGAVDGRVDARTLHSPLPTVALASSGPARPQTADALAPAPWTSRPPLPPGGPTGPLPVGPSMTQWTQRQGPGMLGWCLWREESAGVSSGDLSKKTGGRHQHGCCRQSWGQEERTPPLCLVDP